jgi:hypothetical protein
MRKCGGGGREKEKFHHKSTTTPSSNISIHLGLKEEKYQRKENKE